jgi:hypothetical protein
MPLIHAIHQQTMQPKPAETSLGWTTKMQQMLILLVPLDIAHSLIKPLYCASMGVEAHTHAANLAPHVTMKNLSKDTHSH